MDLKFSWQAILGEPKKKKLQMRKEKKTRTNVVA